MSVLDIYRQVMLAGVIQPLQANLNFASGFTIVANPTLNSLDVSVTGGGGGISALTGDVTASGSGSVAATVARINGATVPAAGSLTTGNTLGVTGASALGYSALNLAGGAGYVTGVLPAANQASQTMGGELSGTTASAVVAGPFSTASLSWLASVTSPTWTQGSATSNVLPQNITLQPQGPYASATGPNVNGGDVIINIPASTSGSGKLGGLQIQYNGTEYARLGVISNIYGGLWLSDSGTSPSTSNFSLEGASNYLFVNAPSGGTLYLSVGATQYAQLTSSQWTFLTAAVAWGNSVVSPTLQSGTGATSLTIGTNKSAATLILQYGAAVTGLTLGGNGLTPGVGTQSCTAGGSITPTAAVLANPYITLTGTLGSNTTIVLPNAVGMWWFDISGLTFGGDTLKFNSGSANTSTISALVTTTEIVQVFCGGGNTISMNL